MDARAFTNACLVVHVRHALPSAILLLFSLKARTKPLTASVPIHDSAYVTLVSCGPVCEELAVGLRRPPQKKNQYTT